MVDIELNVLEAADRVGSGSTIDEYALQAATLSGVKQLAAYVFDWHPVFMEESDED